MVYRVPPRHTQAEHDALSNLATAVLADGEGLIFETLIIRRSIARTPKTIAVEGVHFGTRGLEGYIVEGDNEPLIATVIDFPKRHSELQLIWSISGYLSWLLDDVRPANIPSVIDAASRQIEALLPDGHALKRAEA